MVEGLSLPEGTIVTILAKEAAESVQLSPEEEAELDSAIDEADREEGGISLEELSERLRKYG